MYIHNSDVCCSRLFDYTYHRREVHKKIPQKFHHTVDRLPGFIVECGNTPCVFEMIAYKFIGEVFPIHKIEIALGPPPQPTNGKALSYLWLYL